MKKFPCKSETNTFKSFVCRQEKATAAAVRSLRAKMVSLATVNVLKIIIFVLSYLTVLVYTKTIILFTSLSVASGEDLCIGQIEASTCPPPPGDTPGIWHLCRPGEERIWSSKSSRGWGIWSPCFRGGEFELHPRFHVKSLAWRAIMGDAVLEDFRGKDCAFVANWLRGKGLNKLCAVFEVFKF